MNPPDHLSIHIKVFSQEKKNDFMWWVMLSGKYWDALEIVCCPKNTDPGTHIKLVLVE